MAAKNKRRPIIGYDLQNAFLAHVQATQFAYAAAEKAVALRHRAQLSKKLIIIHT